MGNSITMDATEFKYQVVEKTKKLMSDEELGAAYRRNGNEWMWYLPCIVVWPDGSFRKGFNGGKFAKIYTLRGARQLVKKGIYRKRQSIWSLERQIRDIESRPDAAAHSNLVALKGRLESLKAQKDATIRVYPSIEKVFA